jgi:hypothetical protein
VLTGKKQILPGLGLSFGTFLFRYWGRITRSSRREQRYDGADSVSLWVGSHLYASNTYAVVHALVGE